ncbi:hypothetical protein PRZ48_006630 [Zasmidium cellare]|uniref:NAD(P)-binding protein n=1 Tax=Zasmidium cellare TaxID=395010 RepID=A0ABR0ENX5_ZASCE|nr:hypothetical protein PRZ48_006630 [Zasmidium cellare]
MPSWLVTGASRGLGYAWITHLAAQPDNTVFAIVRNVKATEDRLAKDNVKNITVLSADIVDYSALEKAAAEIAKATGGSLDYLIHNAALVSTESAFTTLLDGKPAAVDADLTESFNANVLGTAHVVRAFLPLIRKGSAKKIVVTSTGMADIDLVNRFSIAIASPYAISKAAANALVSKYHAAVGKSEGILIFSMSPGFVDTSEGKPPSQEEIGGGKAMAAQFAEYAPDFKGPITPVQSVKYQLEVVDKATVETFGGSFVSHFGNKQWL